MRIEVAAWSAVALLMACGDTQNGPATLGSGGSSDTGGRLATGGGGYDAYRVVPRSWALVWLAQAHREPPVETDAAWRARWEDEAQTFGQAPIPEPFLDPAGLVAADKADLRATNATTAQRALAGSLELLEDHHD